MMGELRRVLGVNCSVVPMRSKASAREPSLSLKDSLDLALKAGDKIDVNWRQYFTVVFALLVWTSSNSS